MKARAGWREKNDLEITGKDDKALEPAVRTIQYRWAASNDKQVPSQQPGYGGVGPNRAAVWRGHRQLGQGSGNADERDDPRGAYRSDLQHQPVIPPSVITL